MEWLCVDPGETTGFSLWRDGDMLEAEQLPMWTFIDVVDASLRGPSSQVVAAPDCGHGGLFTPEGTPVELGALVVEDWQLYPWELQNLAWDKCRTARAIGALTLLCRQHGVKLVFQGADIKKGAQAAGAESLYLEPVHENRHANDSIQHGVFYLATKGGPPC